MFLTLLIAKNLLARIMKKSKKGVIMEKRKHEITVSNEIHKKLWELKIKYNFKRLEEVIAYLIQKAGV